MPLATTSACGGVPYFEVHAVKLESRRATAHEAGIAECGAGVRVDPRGHECDTRIVDAINETIRETEMAALGGEADADKTMARSTDASP